MRLFLYQIICLLLVSYSMVGQSVSIGTSGNGQIKVMNSTVAKSNVKSLDRVDYLRLDYESIKSVISKEEDIINVDISSNFGNTQLNLQRTHILSQDFTLSLASGSAYKIDPNDLIFYAGHIKDNPSSIAGLSFINKEIYIFYSSEEGNYFISKLDNSTTYIHYNDSEINIKRQPSVCAHEDDSVDEIIQTASARNNYKGRMTFEFYLEIDHPMLLRHNSSVPQTYKYVFDLFHQEMLLFSNEDIDILLSEVKIWDIPSPYEGIASGQDLLSAFKTEHESSQNEHDILHLLTTNNLGEGRAVINGVCKKEPFAISTGLSTEVLPFTTYSWDILVFSHENGHLLGLKHTHGCYWGGDSNKQIDDCGNYFFTNNQLDDDGNGIIDDIMEAEGFECYDPENPIFPKDGGTLMSYCHLLNGSDPNGPNIGINLSNGFGRELKHRLQHLSNCGCDHPDFYQLIALYHSTNGKYWNQSYGWRDAAYGRNCDPCSWYGVTCDDEQRVIGVELKNNELRGTIPHELAELEFLATLDLSANSLTGCIPTALSIYCGEAQVDFSANPELSHQSSFSDFCVNSFSDCKCNNTDKEVLVILYNLLNGDSWTNNDGWRDNTCDPCNWYGISCDDRNNITEIDLSSNGLSGAFPIELTKLIHLIKLDLADNNLSGPIPDFLQEFLNLTFLDLSQNELFGCIPPSLLNFCDQINFNLDQNPNIVSSFDSFCLTGDNECQCEHPDYDALMEFFYSLGGPNWTKADGWGVTCDPCQWHGLECNDDGRVNQIFIFDNNLDGYLPESLGDLAELEELILPGGTAARLPNKNIKGQIPNSIGKLTKLRTFVLDKSQLNGSFPSSFRNLVNLERIEVHGNQLTGPFPCYFSNFKKLGKINIFNNQLSGPLPPSLGQLTRLGDFIAANNNFEGCIPASYTELCGRRFVRLDANLGLPNNGDFDIFCSTFEGICTDEDMNSHLSLMEKIICESETYRGYKEEGIYSDTLIAKDGCDSIIITDLRVIENTSLQTETDITVPSCLGYNDGSITIYVYNIDSASFQWSSGLVQYGKSSRLSNVHSGLHWVIPSIGNCHGDTVFINVEKPGDLDPDAFQIEGPKCNINEYGSFDANLSQAQQARYSFNWKHTEVQATQFDELPIGTYEYEIVDNEGCISKGAFVIRSQEDFKLEIEGGSEISLCEGEEEIRTSITTISPFATRFYIDGQMTNKELLLTPGEYLLSAENDNNCKDSLLVKIEYESFNIDFEHINNGALCNSQHYLTSSIESSVNNNNYIIKINDAITTLGDTIELTKGENYIQYTTEQGCIWDSLLHVNHEEFYIDLIDTVYVAYPELASIILSNIGAGVIDFVTWSNIDVACLNDICTELQFNSDASGYLFADIKFEEGCTLMDSVYIQVREKEDQEKQPFVPNIIDRKSLNNSKLCIYLDPIEIQSIEISIVDRWGREMLFEHHNVSSSKNCINYTQSYLADVNPGVFIYFIKIKRMDGSTKVHTGDVTIL